MDRTGSPAKPASAARPASRTSPLPAGATLPSAERPSCTIRESADAAERLGPFRMHVLAQGRALYRDLPWRRTRDPYAIWISEVMLQQTQVSRVDGRWQRWLSRFPSVDALASASQADVLEEWQGLGYNRRALALHRAAQAVSEAGGHVPTDVARLVALPGIGPATAAGIRAFAHNLHAVYLETNVRAVLLHELYPDAERVPDAELVPIVDATCPPDGAQTPPETDGPTLPAPFADDPRTWYYALLDYGAYLKRTLPNPSRRSATHARQSRFEGSHRQKRAMLVRALLARRDGATATELAAALGDEELRAGRTPIGAGDIEALLAELASEGFCHAEGGLWVV